MLRPMTNKHNFPSLFNSALSLAVGHPLKNAFLSLAVLLAMFAIPVSNLWSATSASAQFVKVDSTTQGNWQGVYGADGAIVIGNHASYPSYAVVGPSGQTEKTWVGSSSDPRALQELTNPTGRIAAAWIGSSTFSVDLNLTDGNSHQVALYCLDWNALGRAEYIAILNATSGALLNVRTISSFSQTPKYLIWNLQGHVIINVTRTAGANAVLSGIFFGGVSQAPPPPPPPPTVGISMTPTSASLTGSQSAQFNASVTGTSNTAVAWSINPGVGTIVNGVYTAPATIGIAQAVTVTASSVADSTKSAVAIVNLIPVSLSLSPGTASLTGGQSATFTPTVAGTSNTAIAWSLSPAIGSIANGVYQAPTVIASQQTVTILATSVADSTKLASAAVSLIPIGVTVGPGSVSLGVGASATFAASVTGTGTTAVNWSLNPAVGSIANGVYTAPASIAGLQTVTLTAASAVDPTKTATASITLIPVTLSITPGTASLGDGQSATFTSTVTGTSNTSVTWSLSPAVGSIANGVYQAPAAIANQQTVTVTATSVADSSKTASATLSLTPVAVTIGPASVSLQNGASTTFAASVTGTSNTAVAWSINPAIGSIASGVYTAPANISASQTVTVTATSVVDPTKTATAVVTLSPSIVPVSMPIEVLGANGTTATATVVIPSGANVNGQLSLYMRLHGLRTETQASVQVNNSAWMPISDSTVTLQGNATAYGGIGGGFSTLKMTMNLPSGVVQPGANTITFRFNQTDGRVSGFRVLAFNIQAADGSSLIPVSTFVNEDPDYWQPPSTNPSDIATGQALWHQAPLTIPILTGGTAPILAHCSDCHAQDGRDLKYFNYSNNSIEARSVFHGLTAQQGAQIASYIRSLNVVNPGRPWNPPYQPGPGLDSLPVTSWSAGAGIDAVLDNDQEMLNAMFPSGIQPSVFAATSRLNQRELPLPVQLPDWNQWLPGTHPMDAFGSAFTNSGYNTVYQTLSSSLQVLNPTVYAAQQQNFGAWFSAFYGFYNQMGAPIWTNPATMWTPANVDAMYSLSQWGLVKTWELNNQFQLEGMSQAIFGPQGEARAWNSSLPFFVSPHELKMPSSGVTGLRNGSQADYLYLSYIWYNMQLILNDSNGHQQDHFPIDWGYANDFVEGLGVLVPPQGGIQTMWMIKGLQILQATGTGPQLGMEGWQPNVTQLSMLVTPEWNLHVWTGEDPSTRATLATNIVQSWLQQASQFTPQQFYTGNWTTATATPVPGGNPYDSVWVDQFWYMIPRFKFIGVDPTLVSQLAQFAQKMWPSANWTADLNATCNWYVDPPNEPANFLIKCNQ